MSAVAALLAIVATIAAHQHVDVYCHPPAEVPVWGDVIGWTRFGKPPVIYLRYCLATVRRKRWAVDTLAHELLHVKHPAWSHRLIYRYEHSFGAIVYDILVNVQNTRIRRAIG